MTEYITIQITKDGTTMWMPAGVNVKTVAPKVVEQRKIETVAKPRAVAKVKGKRKRLLNGHNLSGSYSGYPDPKGCYAKRIG